MAVAHAIQTNTHLNRGSGASTSSIRVEYFVQNHLSAHAGASFSVVRETFWLEDC